MARILVADDDENLPELIATLLEKDGHAVMVARSGTEAIQCLVSGQFDVIILDWDMPGVDGVRVCRGYRQRGGMAHIIMLTGRSDLTSKEAGFEAGADDYMTKPFKARELLARISACLRRQAITASHAQQMLNSIPGGQPQALSNPPGNLTSPDHPPSGSNSNSRNAAGHSLKGISPEGLNNAAALPPMQGVNGHHAAAPANAPECQNLVGHVLADRYEILERLGQGGMGLVYKARQTALDRLVAVKVMGKDLLHDATALQRFQREARMLSMIEHPNLVIVHDFGKTLRDEPFMVMEFLEGKTLDEVIEKESLALLRCIDIFIQLSEGMQAAHDKNLIHRDLKPANVMLVEKRGRETVKILDLGLAKFLADEQQSLKLTKKGEVFGSPLYMSPEQCMAKEMDHRSDIYSMGCMLFECVANKPPLVGYNFMSTSLKHVTEKPQPLSDLAENVPPQLNAIVMQCLEKAMEDRPASMNVVRDCLIEVRNVVSLGSSVS